MSNKSVMASVSLFQSSIIRVRDILRSVSITGMDSMRHICLYLLSRYMTRSKVETLEIPEEFAWENLVEIAQTKNGGLQKALDSFYHQDEDCLVNHFDRLFGTDKFSFDVRNLQKHKEILEVLHPIQMEEVDTQMDILGWVYEQHLRTGSSAARDLGQFFTDRFICEYMARLCAPKFKSPGIPESVCDPTMGTGGLLTAYVKYFKKFYPESPVDWAVQQKEIHGCDTDPKVAGVARLNLFMETGGNRVENLLTKDSLQDDLTQLGYDIILANMPFGLKGLKHADCCERVKNLKIRGTKSEPLFLQLMMTSLNPGGRCAVVVPDGMLVNNSSCHNETRKYLLEHFDLKRVIKMKGQFFMNTGIQPSILFFENTGNPTEAVEFWDVVRGDKGDVTETMNASVPLQKIASDKSYSLDLRRYMESDKSRENLSGFPMVKLGDLLTDHPINKPIATKDADGGVFSLFSSSCDVFKHSVAEFRGRPYLLQGSRGTISKATHYCDTPFSASNNVFVLSATNPSSVSLKFIYYFLRLSNVADQTATTSVIPMLTKTMFREIKIPLPPLPIQQEIVTTLDRVYAPGTTELADTLKMTDKAMDLVLAQPNGSTLEPIVEAQRLIRKSAQMIADVKAQMIADVKAQMIAIMKSIGSRGFPIVKISDVMNVVSGKANTEREDTHSIPYYDSNGVIGYVEKPLYTGEYTITARNLSIGAVHYVNGAFYPSDHTINFTSKDTNRIKNLYFYYWLLLNNKVLKDLSSGIKPGIRKSDVVEIQMPLPPLSFQSIVLTRLESLQSQLSALENLQKQSEDNARFILESYLHKSEESHSSSCGVLLDGTGCTCRVEEQKEEPRNKYVTIINEDGEEETIKVKNV